VQDALPKQVDQDFQTAINVVNKIELDEKKKRKTGKAL
jgi:hypothetical protein